MADARIKLCIDRRATRLEVCRPLVMLRLRRTAALRVRVRRWLAQTVEVRRSIRQKVRVP
ncbi:MAG: hypothetical protein AAF447_08455 [Myxococcota bacterium]